MVGNTSILKVCRALKRTCSGWRKSLASRGGRQKIEFGLRERPTQWCLDQNQTDQSSRVCHWRLHTARRKPEVLRLLARWLPRSGRASIRRQSRDRLFRKTPGEHRCAIAKDKARNLPVHQPTGEITRQVGARDHPGCYETLPLGQTCARGTGQIYRVDIG